MGYESKIIVAEKSDWGCGEIHYFPVAEVDLSKAGNDFLEIYNKFGKPIENEFFYEGDFIEKDKYGDICKEVDIEVLKDGLNKIVTKDKYRRYTILKGLLDSFNPYDLWDKIVCIHYGH